jgi:hypothetical protein
MNRKPSIFSRWLQKQVDREMRTALSDSERFFNINLKGGGSEIDRYAYDRDRLLADALEAWRVNPLARRIVGLTSQYVVGGGITYSCPHPATAAFLRSFWEHPLNAIAIRAYEWCDELTRSGNLFLLLSSNAAGMTYVRAVPASQVKTIFTRENDLDQETGFELKPAEPGGVPQAWPAFDPHDPAASDGSFAPAMLHYAINRPVGSVWGESDLAPVLRWLSRYAGWLEDRARLNHFRTSFLYVVRSRFSSEAERRARQASLNAAPPSPGSILVTDESETWDVLHPALEADDAANDGMALKKMIAAGAGIPLHFLAEPEGTTRTTAEAAGGPTYRHFEQRQNFFLWLLHDLLTKVVQRRALVDQSIARQAEIHLHGADISARDNLSLAMAASSMLNVLSETRSRGLIDDAEFLRLVYRFSGEAVNVEEMLARGSAAAPAPASGRKSPQQNVSPVDTETGETKDQNQGGTL